MTSVFFWGINQNVLQHAQQRILPLHAKTSQRCISVSRSTLVCAYVTWQENELRFVIILFRMKYPELSGNTHTHTQAAGTLSSWGGKYIPRNKIPPTFAGKVPPDTDKNNFIGVANCTCFWSHKLKSTTRTIKGTVLLTGSQVPHFNTNIPS